MTMTDTEAKALALVKDLRMSMTLGGKLSRPFLQITADAAHYIEATEARHAAELREQAERFSEVAVRVKRLIEEAKLSRLVYDCPDGSRPSFIVDALAPFILPKPDPLVEVFGRENAAEIHAALAARGGKIVWGEE